MGVAAIMMVRAPDGVPDDQLKVLVFDLAEAFGGDTIFHSEESPSLTRVRSLDSTPGDAVGGDWLDVNVSRVYYGRGYERGPLASYLAIAAWLESRIPRAEVWYGSEEDPQIGRFDAEARSRLFDYFCLVGHKPYFKPGLAYEIASGVEIPECCGVPMTLGGLEGTGNSCPALLGL